MNVADWGWNGTPPEKGAVARVIAAHGDYYRIVCDEGEGIARKKSGAFHGRADAIKPTTGDFVAIRWNPQGESRILATLPRHSKFERMDPSSSGRAAQVIAVNFDALFLLMSANRNFNLRRLERFLAMGGCSGAEVAVVLTKCDLLERPEDARELVERVRAVAPGVAVHAVSSRTGEGLDALGKYVRPRHTLAFVGSSGVGKSTLVNALAGEELMPTLEVREWDDKGRHTTTERELVRLPSGAMVIDTPGMREIGLWEAADGLADAFADVTAIFPRCRFSDCRHRTEPGCAVRAALESGELAAARWEAYCRLQEELAGAATRRGAAEGVSHRYRK